MAALTAGLALVAIAIAALLWLLLRRRLSAGAGEQSKVPEAYLFDLENATSKSSYILSKPTTRVGRGATNDIWINKDTVSALHATIEYRDGAFLVRDRKSTNGTFINNRRVRQDELKSGDVLAFHEYKFRFVLPEDSEMGQTLVAKRSGEAGSSF